MAPKATAPLLEEDGGEGRECFDCQVTVTTQWRRVVVQGMGRVLCCNACGCRRRREEKYKNPNARRRRRPRKPQAQGQFAGVGDDYDVQGAVAATRGLLVVVTPHQSSPPSQAEEGARAMVTTGPVRRAAIGRQADASSSSSFHQPYPAPWRFVTLTTLPRTPPNALEVLPAQSGVSTSNDYENRIPLPRGSTLGSTSDVLDDPLPAGSTGRLRDQIAEALSTPPAAAVEQPPLLVSAPPLPPVTAALGLHTEPAWLELYRSCFGIDTSVQHLEQLSGLLSADECTQQATG